MEESQRVSEVNQNNITQQSSLSEDLHILLLVRNIPSDYHSSDLRGFFSLFVERGAFKCFHFRHRPEKLDETDEKKPQIPITKTLCCFVKVYEKFFPDLMTHYNGKHWENSQGVLLSTKCHILRLRMAGGSNGDGSTLQLNSSQYLTREERRVENKYHRIHQELKESEVDALIEMNPPAIMPNGNVGTPNKHFLALINSCQMPAGLIKKLGLRFPKGRKNRKFGQVGMDYGSSILPGRDDDEASDNEEGYKEHPSTSGEKFVWFDKSEREQRGDDDGDDLDNDDCQEWERHEALNDDVTTHERKKERLFEDEAEVVWEKGGPGIVWNMDANFWKEQAGGDDLDEATDDWDVDMSCYYEDEKDNPGDRDAKDSMQIRREKEMRAGTAPSIFRQPSKPSYIKKTQIVNGPGVFENHTKGIGRKLLEKWEWKEGSGIGKDETGIIDPLSGDGQMPYSRRGLGFAGKPIARKERKPESVQHINRQAVLEPGNFGIQITTCYDVHDPKDTLKRRAAPYRLSYRSSES